VTRVERHRSADRLIHWLIAIAMLTLLATALPSQMAMKFKWPAPGWVIIHWVTGLVLTLLILLQQAAQI